MDFDTLIETCYTLYNEKQETLKLMKSKEDFIQWQKDTLHFYRVQIEPYVFNYMNYIYGDKLDEFWKTHQFPKKSNKAFVVVERRSHPNWWFLLRNIAWAAPHFSLYIFCSDLNYNFIKTVLGDKAENVHIIIWFKGLADRNTGFMEANYTFKIPHFYKLIDAEYVINVHLDAYFLQKIPDWIFTGTYYGSPWSWDTERAGNGGLAVRNIKNMIELCEKEINTALNETIEDDYISNMIIKNNYDYPPLEFRLKVFQESAPTSFNPIGTHQFWTYIMNYNINNRDEFTKNIKKLVTLIGI